MPLSLEVETSRRSCGRSDEYARGRFGGALTKELPRIGWREWVALPELGVAAINVKIDTGAGVSALHAANLVVSGEEGSEVATFEIQIRQRSATPVVAVKAAVDRYVRVRSSSGQSERRPVVTTTVHVGSQTWDIELTLTRRDEMGYRMLLGRQAVRRRFVVDPGRSYLFGRPPKEDRP